MIKALSADKIASELADDRELWFVVTAEDPDSFILTPDANVDGVLYLFLRQEDAEHYHYLISKLAPPFKDKKLITVSDVKEEIIRLAIEYKQYIGVIPPNAAHDFFKEYEEYLGKYYGL